MQFVVLANDSQREELLSNGTGNDMDITWIKAADEFRHYQSAEAYIDLLFDGTDQRIELLKTVSSKTIIINSVIHTLRRMNAPFIRINAWPGFLKREVIEAANNDETTKRQDEKILSCLNKRTKWVKDEPGFITARVIAMIINEAWFALGENVSTKEEIDVAMKLGTNYPLGPFEWGNKIGIRNIFGLLVELSKTDSRYKPAPLLEKEANV